MRATEIGATAHRTYVCNCVGEGWGSYKNGQLLLLAEEEFDLFLTCDRNLQYQQNLKGRKIAILLLSTNHWPTLKPQAAVVQAALEEIQPGGFLPVTIKFT